jgi:hypothetical protein
MPTISERIQKRQEKKYQKEAQDRETALHEYERYEASKKTGRLPIEDKAISGRKKILERKKEERELKKQEKEFAHPVRTRAVRRAEKMAGLGVERAQQTASTATRVAGGRLRAVASRARVSPTTRRLPRDKPGRTRLPVFQEGAPSFAERIALDFGTKQPEDVLQGQQQPLLASRPLDLFGEGKQYDLGLGNGNKKKVRYY